MPRTMGKKNKATILKATIPTMINPDTGNNIQLTIEVIEQAERLYRIGIQDNAIANYLGINPKLMKEWLIKGASYDRGIHGEFFRRCAKAVTGNQLEYVGELRKHAFGTPAEYEYDFVKDKDGKVQKDEHGRPLKEIARDDEGKPIIKKSEVKGNAVWISWLLERRHRKQFGKQEEIDIYSCAVDEGKFDAVLNSDAQKEGNQEIDVGILNEGEQLKVLKAATIALELKMKPYGDDDESES